MADNRSNVSRPTSGYSSGYADLIVSKTINITKATANHDANMWLCCRSKSLKNSPGLTQPSKQANGTADSENPSGLVPIRSSNIDSEGVRRFNTFLVS
ncbi:hypothetical protein TrispH2_004432 [Trichoplax sp. H2]|nr:hypothetical protein TrispH2_004432 [Trichoplax sp. H2]|eukprot:RDD43162.1 hypothetical protein TrispH2_004432 [Trichoplax sp. H2]